MRQDLSGLDPAALRALFPALERHGPGKVFFDNPAGTQIAARSLARMTAAMLDANANLGGFFETSVAAGELVGEARRTAAAFLKAESPDEIVFGPSMTALTFSVARALAPSLAPGDEILLTRMDHDANVAPWLLLAEERGLAVRWLDFDPDAFEFDLATLDGLLSERTRIAAINFASNLLGTVNDVRTIATRVREAGGLSYVDAVQFAPHGLIDVQDLGCDFLVCSAYKFYGPHQAVLWGRSELIDSLPAQKVRPAATSGPGRWEMGTKSREAIAGVMGAIEHFAEMGDRFAGTLPSASLRERIVAGMEATERHERGLTALLLGGLGELPEIKVHGLTATQALSRRVPTVSFTVDGLAPAALARDMAEAGIFLWSGHNYGLEPVRRLGLDEAQGVVRVGLAQYNTAEEVAAFLERLRACLRRQAGRSSPLDPALSAARAPGSSSPHTP